MSGGADRTIAEGGGRCVRVGGPLRPSVCWGEVVRHRIITAVACAVAAVVPGAAAQEFPGGKAIDMTVMFGAGSAADTTARELARGMEKPLGVPVVTVNRTGAGGAIGYTHVHQQKPDGHSIIWNSNSVSTTYHSGIIPFDYRAFDAVARVSVETPAIAVRSDAPWRSLKELLDYARANPGKVRIGNSGTGSHTHFAASALFKSAGATVINVPFTEGEAVVNLLGSRIEGAVQLPAAVLPQVQSGDLRVLAVLGGTRVPVLPDVPTATEAGYPVVLDMWRGIAVPAGTPRPVIDKLQDAVRDAVQSPAFAAAGTTIGFVPAYLPAPAFATLITEDDARLAQMMDGLGLKKK